MLLLFSFSVMYNSLQPTEQQHTRPPCLSLSPWVCSNSRPLISWYHPTVSLSVIPFSSCHQSSPESGSFPVSQLFASDGPSIGASTSVFPMNIQGWFPLGLTDLISLQSKGLSRVFSNAAVLMGSQGKNAEVVYHSLLQWTTFCQNSQPWPIHLEWPYTA